MTNSKGRKVKNFLLLPFLIYAAVQLPALSTQRRPLSHGILGLTSFGCCNGNGSQSHRSTAFVVSPSAPFHQLSVTSYGPNGHRQPLRALRVDSRHLPGSKHPQEHGILGRLWSRVKGLFRSSSKGTSFPIVSSIKGIQSAHAPPMVSIQNMRGLQSMNLPLNVVPGIQGDASASSDGSPYTQLIRSQPSVVMGQFMDKSPQRVKDAAKSTIGALVGSFYRYCIETTIITSSDRLAVLIHSMQMTGYMLWNADCRFCLSQQLSPEGLPRTDTVSQEVSNEAKGGAVNPAPQMRDELVQPYQTDSLLSYIKQMPDKTANSLLDNMSTGVMEAMQDSIDMTVESLTGVPVTQPPGTSSNHRVIVQQTGSSCVQLCMWHLSLGYCLRDQEAKIELQKALKGS